MLLKKQLNKEWINEWMAERFMRECDECVDDIYNELFVNNRGIKWIIVDLLKVNE